MVKSLPANAGHTGDASLIPGSGRVPLEKEKATHSSILAWKILWTEEPGGLQSMGLQTVGHNWANEHAHQALNGFYRADFPCPSDFALS